MKKLKYKTTKSNEEKVGIFQTSLPSFQIE